jgi:hypothetical protein
VDQDVFAGKEPIAGPLRHFERVLVTRNPIVVDGQRFEKARKFPSLYGSRVLWRLRLRLFEGCEAQDSGDSLIFELR